MLAAGTSARAPWLARPARKRPPRCARRRGRARSSDGEAASRSTSDPRPAIPPAPRPPPPIRRRSARRPIPSPPRPVAASRRIAARSWSLPVGREELPPLGHARTYVYVEDPQNRVLTGDRPRLADRLRQPPSPVLLREPPERGLVARGRPRPEPPQAQRGRGAGELLQLRQQRQAQALGVRAGPAKPNRHPPAAAPGQPRGEPQPSQAP